MIAPSDRLRIIVLGYIVRGPVGGLTWDDLHYLLGLNALGHDVYFVEDSGDSPWCCYDPSTHGVGTDCRYGLQFAARVLGKLGLERHWAYYDAHAKIWHGPCSDVFPLIKSADLLLDLGGVTAPRPWFETACSCALVDRDPVFTQIRNLTARAKGQPILRHNSFFTFGENIGKVDSSIPDDGFPWQPTRHPIHLDAWPMAPMRPHSPFTTVMQWDSYAPVHYGGRHYGLKSDSFGPFLELPKRVKPTLELAVGSSTAPRECLARNGWRLRDPLEASADPWTYQRYIESSKAEFTVAKHGYVASHSGWFSERSASYLASGRPVVTQDTGFTTWLPAGDGVLAFSTYEAAVAAIEDVNSRYEHHCSAARELAEAYFDGRTILSSLLERAIVSESTLH